jgi:hypothetical protein
VNDSQLTLNYLAHGLAASGRLRQGYGAPRQSAATAGAGKIRRSSIVDRRSAIGWGMMTMDDGRSLGPRD